ncbi:hypothetical protein KZZ07_11135 [Mameliella sp. CS4]|uniref:hypothetical protein n=1 Tax=Mameliella sp. CS4 TaxID=2862329 RepID=UPI001C5F024A|nr:hypothetical protein [Mameliella sp. CS4]MBW4983095.1 hypothetical protein [Mameliella sp. CS4]
MPIRWITAATVLATVALLVVGVNQLPPLTQGGLPRSGPPPFGAVSAPADPAAWCRANLSDVNCGCFAQKADEVMSAPHERLQGLSYANRWDLARAQAGAGC